MLVCIKTRSALQKHLKPSLQSLLLSLLQVSCEKNYFMCFIYILLFYVVRQLAKTYIKTYGFNHNHGSQKPYKRLVSHFSRNIVKEQVSQKKCPKCLLYHGTLWRPSSPSTNGENEAQQ